MPYLNVVPTSFRLCVMAGKEQDHNVSLAGTLRLTRKEKVTLSTDENFEQLDGNLSIFERTSDEPNEDEILLGTIRYSEKLDTVDLTLPASYNVYIYLPKARFEILLAAVSRGQKPSEIMINIEEGGMQYGWQPDGSGKVWDNKTTPELLIKSITFITPLIGGDPSDYLDDRQQEDGMPPSKAQLNELKERLAELKTVVHSRLNWLLILVASLLGLVVYRLN